MSVLDEIAAERRRQDGKWGGPAHDDAHSTAEFVQFIEDYAGWARQMASMNSPSKARRRLIQVAALAVAAVESMDRRSANNGSQPSAAPDAGFPRFYQCRTGCIDDKPHQWDGPEWVSEDGCGVSATCSRCGMTAMHHSLMTSE